MAKELLDFKGLKEKLAEALNWLNMANPDPEKRQEAAAIHANIDKHIKLAAIKMKHDQYVKDGGTSISFLKG